MVEACDNSLAAVDIHSLPRIVTKAHSCDVLDDVSHHHERCQDWRKEMERRGLGMTVASTQKRHGERLNQQRSMTDDKSISVGDGKDRASCANEVVSRVPITRACASAESIRTKALTCRRESNDAGETCRDGCSTPIRMWVQPHSGSVEASVACPDPSGRDSSVVVACAQPS